MTLKKKRSHITTDKISLISEAERTVYIWSSTKLTRPLTFIRFEIVNVMTVFYFHIHVYQMHEVLNRHHLDNVKKMNTCTWWVSVRLLLSYILWRTNCISMRWWCSWWRCPFCTRATHLCGFCIVLVHWNNCSQVDMSLHSDTLS